MRAGEFVTMKNPVLLRHQKEYVRKILDATGIWEMFLRYHEWNRNGTGTNEEWVWEIIKTVRDWEKEKKVRSYWLWTTKAEEIWGVLPGMQRIGLDRKRSCRYDEHVEAKQRYGKPTISVRNIDYNYKNKNDCTFSGNIILKWIKIKIFRRGRKYWWRMYMAECKSQRYADSIQ